MPERTRNNKYGGKSVRYRSTASRAKMLDLTSSAVRVQAPNRPQRESGPVEFLRSIPVRDAKGDELTVYEFHERRFLRRVRRMKLCTGELVEALDDQSFVLVGTGEKLTRL